MVVFYKDVCVGKSVQCENSGLLQVYVDLNFELRLSIVNAY